MKPYTVTRSVHFKRGRKYHNHLRRGKPPKRPKGRIPRLSRLMALAITYDEMLRQGEVRDMATLARREQVTRPRMTQIMDLILLAPDIQEEILFFPKTDGRRFPISQKYIEPLTRVPDWNRQRELWTEIKKEKLDSNGNETASA